ncbi:MAG: hypothetical protein FJW20_14885 [Acidimicrobiia bacterium]|nr:hypothetical protein [Acidimicrobiia bacterium]
MSALLWLMVGALAVTTACSRQDTGKVRVDAELAKLVPAGTLHLIGGDFRAIRETTTYEKLIARRGIPPLENFARQTGLDPRTDLDEFLIASTGEGAVLLARGRFQREKLERKLTDVGAKSFTHQSQRLLGNEEAVASFPKDGVAVGGTQAAVKAALEGAAVSSGLAEPLVQQIKRITERPHLWAVTAGGLPPLELPQTGMLGNLHKIYASLETAVFWVDLESGVKLRAAGSCTSEEAAKQVRGGLKALIGLGRLSTPQDRAELLRFYDGVEVLQEGAEVRFHADFPLELVEQVIAMFPSRR